ncbi:MAG: branched-chain amino acid ABC transporter permease [Deltaproteobacteria bacterium]|nr:branched-chain amino acid ABC transporter permease [Deltaproteobacteria bacterium]
MVSYELKRDRVTIRTKDKKWEWIIEPRYWRNSIIWVSLLFIFPIVSYFVYPGLINTMISANLLASIAMPMSLMTMGTGRVNFGPNFFVGVGGYTAALLSIHFGMGPLASLPFAVAITLFTALLYSPLVIVARGLYYVLLSLLLPLVFFEITVIYTDIFKGDTGLFGIKPLIDTGNAKINFLVIAYLSLALMIAYLWGINKMIKSRYGLVMAAINDDEEVAHGIGVNISKVKIISFVAAASMIGVVGWFYAHYFSSFAGQTYLTFTFMLKVFLVLMVGGRAQIFGAVVGGYFVTFLEMLMIRFMGPIQPVLFPIILLVLLFVLPEGLFGIYRKRRYREYFPTIHVRR